MPPKIKPKLKKPSSIKKTVSQIKKVAKEETPQERQRKPVDVDTLVPSPSTTFNLECSGKVEGAFQLGKIANVIGDSHAGKTLFVLSTFAECNLLERFDDYRFIYDDPEEANEFDLEYLFGSSCADRIEAPNVDESGHALNSDTIEDFNGNVARALDDGRPFIYVLDSFDALSSEASRKKDAENIKKNDAGKEGGGSYGDGKAKIMSDFFKHRVSDLKKSKSLLIVISQTRDNLGFGAMFTPKVRSGGKALKFFSCHEIWLACNKREKKGKKKNRTFKTTVQAKISKNKVTGRQGEAYFPILFDYGVDDITSCINFLLEEGDWTGTAQSINTQGFYDGGNVSTAKLVSWVEENEMEDELKQVCQKAYDAIMESLKPKRKSRY